MVAWVEVFLRLFSRRVVVVCLFPLEVEEKGLFVWESSLEMWTIGSDDSAKLWDGLGMVGGEFGSIGSTGQTSGGSRMFCGCCSWEFSEIS